MLNIFIFSLLFTFEDKSLFSIKSNDETLLVSFENLVYNGVSSDSIYLLHL